MSRYSLAAASALIVLSMPNAANAQATVTLTSGPLIDVCILEATSGGVLTRNGEGTLLGSEESGGSPGTLTVVALGTSPTLTFQAPSISTPGGDSTTTGEIAYSSIGGADQDYTDALSTASAGALLDTFTVHGRLLNDDGFLAGTYQISTVVTCSQ